jgi:hypothetical protein
MLADVQAKAGIAAQIGADIEQAQVGIGGQRFGQSLQRSGRQAGAALQVGSRHVACRRSIEQRLHIRSDDAPAARDLPRRASRACEFKHSVWHDRAIRLS